MLGSSHLREIFLALILGQSRGEEEFPSLPVSFGISPFAPSPPQHRNSCSSEQFHFYFGVYSDLILFVLLQQPQKAGIVPLVLKSLLCLNLKIGILFCIHQQDLYVINDQSKPILKSAFLMYLEADI